MEKIKAFQDGLPDITKEQMEQVIQLFHPCMNDYLYVADFKEDSYCISRNATERFLLPGEHFFHLNDELRKFVVAEDYEKLQADLQLLAEGKKEFHDMSYHWLSREGNPVWINCRGRLIRDEENRPRFLIGCINEIGRKQVADNLSGLLGEKGLSDCLGRYNDKLPAGFLMRVGIDHLGAINGNLGMEYGDFIIKKTAECMTSALREGQQIFRLIADEFVILDLNGRDFDEAIALYEDMSRNVRTFIEGEQYRAVFTLSAGIVNTAEIHDGMTTVLKYTEFALDEAKNRGRNSYYLFEKEDYLAFRRRRKVNTYLHHGVNHEFQGFDTYYQPIVDAQTYEVIGAEALMRFFSQEENGTERKPISPVEFIPLLEQSGLIIPSGRWILQTAVSQCRKWQKDMPKFRMNVNLSYIQVMKSNALEEIIGAVRLYGLQSASLGIELTESGYLESSPHFKKLWSGLKEHGVQVVLDDFGTGYSNLHCLGDLRPNYVKVDRSFTYKAFHNDYEQLLMKQIIEMSHSLGLAICIEGIETEEELAKAKSLGADYIQGYFFGKPCPAEEFEEKFIKRTAPVAG